MTRMKHLFEYNTPRPGWLPAAALRTSSR